MNKPPKITDSMGQWHLGDDEIPMSIIVERVHTFEVHYLRFKKESAKTALM